MKKAEIAPGLLCRKCHRYGAIDTPFNHYNLLATLEAAHGVDCLGHACEAKDALIEGLFD